MKNSLVPAEPDCIPTHGSARKSGSDLAVLLAKTEDQLQTAQQGENELRCENEGIARKLEAQAKQMKSLASQNEALRVANRDLSFRVLDLEVRVHELTREGASIQHPFPMQFSPCLPLQQARQLAEKERGSAGYSELKQQLHDFQIALTRNDELSAAVSELNGKIDALGHQVAHEQGARQRAEMTLAQLKDKIGKHKPAPAPAPLPDPVIAPIEYFSPETPSATTGQPSQKTAAPVAEQITPAVNPPGTGSSAAPATLPASAVDNLASPGTGVISDKIEKTLAQMRRSLPYFVRHTGQLGVLDELNQQIGVVTSETAKTGILPLHQIATALQIVLQEFRKTPSLINLTRLRTVGQALELISQLTEKGNTGALKGLTSARILAVDDDGDVLEIVATLLESLALKVHSIKDANQVLPVLKQHKFHLVMLDIGMPEHNGLELCAQVRKLNGYSATPVIFLTGMTAADSRAQSALAGGDDFVSKPFHAAELGLKSIFWAFKGRLAELKR